MSSCRELVSLPLARKNSAPTIRSLVTAVIRAEEKKVIDSDTS